MALTTNEVLTFDGVQLNTYAKNISTITGRLTTPQIRGDSLILPSRSGYIFTPNRPLGPGELILNMWVLGCNDNGVLPSGSNYRAQFQANWDSLSRLFTRRSKLSHITKVLPDTTTRECDVEVVEQLDPEAAAGGTRAEFSVALNIPSVFWQDTNPITQSATAGATLPKTLNLTSFAGMTGTIEDAVVTVTGPIVNPRVTESETGIYVQLNDTLTASQTWVVDCGNFTSVKGGSTDVVINTVHVGHPRFLIVTPWNGTTTTPQLILSGTGGGSATNFSIAARRKWVTA